MINHLLKIIWNRKRANALPIAELFLSFLGLFGLGTLVAVAAQGLRRAPGSTYADVWELRLSTNNDPTSATSTVARLLAHLQVTPGVTDVSLDSFGTLFSMYNMNAKISTGAGAPPLAGDGGGGRPPPRPATANAGGGRPLVRAARKRGAMARRH